jgi:hypothetical protein
LSTRDGFPAHQRGLALLIVIVGLVLMALAFIANGLLSQRAQIRKNTNTSVALARAKEALIAYAVTYSYSHSDNVPGYLPCPDAGISEGTSAATCGGKNVSTMRRLPWRTLGIEPLRDSNGECLWYLVSGTFKNSPQTDLMNWDNNGLLEVLSENGTTLLAGDVPGNRAAAVIISPGSAIGAQNRTRAGGASECGGNYVTSNYLDSQRGINNAVVSAIANGISRVIAGEESESFNDRMIFITPEEIFEPIRKRKDFQTRIERLTRSIAECVGKYGEFNGNPLVVADHRLPWPAPVSLTSFTANNSYGDSAAGSRKSGRLPFVVNTSKGTTANSMDGTSLLRDGNDLCPSWSIDDAAWYQNWKDQLFYAVAGSYAPTAAYPTPGSCPACLSVNGAGDFAAVVLFAGKKTIGQARNTLAEKRLISNYVEGRNSASYPNTSGDFDLEQGGSVNDLLFCVDFDFATHKSRVFACP